MLRDAQPSALEGLGGIALDELHFGRHVAEPDGEVSRVHLIRERRLQRFRRTGGSDDGQVRARNKRRQEEWKSLDVVEMRMGDEKVRLQRLGLRKCAAQLGNA